MSETIIYLRRGRLVFAALGSVAFVAGGFFLMMHPELADEWMAQLIGAISILFFGAASFYILFRLVKPKPAVILRDDGIIDQASGLAAGFIPWSEITSVHIATMHYQRFLCLVPSHPDLVLAQQSAAKRALMQANIGLVGTPVAIPMDYLNMPGDQLLAEVEGRVAQAHTGAAR